MTSRSLDAAQLVTPTSREDAIEAFGDGAELTVLAGGTILMPELNYGRLRPARVLALWNAGVAGIRREGSSLTIGAMTPVVELEAAPEPLATAARSVADREIRAQATLGSPSGPTRTAVERNTPPPTTCSWSARSPSTWSAGIIGSAGCGDRRCRAGRHPTG